MRSIRFLLMLPAGALLACAAPQALSAKATVDQPETYVIVCKDESSGTHIPQRVCRSKDQLAQERAEAQRIVTQAWMKASPRR